MNYMYQLEGLSTIGIAEGDRYYAYRKYRLGETAIFSEYIPGGYGDLVNSRYTNTFIMDYSDGSGLDIDETSVVES